MPGAVWAVLTAAAVGPEGCVARPCPAGRILTHAGGRAGRIRRGPGAGTAAGGPYPPHPDCRPKRGGPRARQHAGAGPPRRQDPPGVRARTPSGSVPNMRVYGAGHPGAVRRRGRDTRPDLGNRGTGMAAGQDGIDGGHAADAPGSSPPPGGTRDVPPGVWSLRHTEHSATPGREPPQPPEVVGAGTVQVQAGHRQPQGGLGADGNNRYARRGQGWVWRSGPPAPYHSSIVGAVYAAFKTVFGDSPSTRTPNTQVTEATLHVLEHSTASRWRPAKAGAYCEMQERLRAIAGTTAAGWSGETVWSRTVSRSVYRGIREVYQSGIWTCFLPVYAGWTHPYIQRFVVKHVAAAPHMWPPVHRCISPYLSGPVFIY